MKKFAIVAVLSAVSLGVCAQDAYFFDTSAPVTPFSAGVRIGVNSANQTHSGNGLSSNLDSWGTGFNVGAVFDINLRDYLTIEPGIFLDVRNNKYCHSTTTYNQELKKVSLLSNEGSTRHTSVTIPVMASVRFNFSDNVRWHVDCGPYFQFGLGGYDKGDFLSITNNAGDAAMYSQYKNGYYTTRNKFDWGLKFGTAIRFLDHYYAGIHYEAGFCRVYKIKENGGRNKTWLFSIGYDF